MSATDMTDREPLRSAAEKGAADVNVMVLGAHGSSAKLLSLNLQPSHRHRSAYYRYTQQCISKPKVTRLVLRDTFVSSVTT